MSSEQPSRRTVLKSAAAGALALTAAPSILTAMKTDTNSLIVGTGRHTYEVIDNWAKRPADKPWGDTHMVQEVGDGRIFICHNGPESVHVYDPDGKFITSWGDDMKGAAHGMDLRKENGEEFLYFSPTGQHRVAPAPATWHSRRLARWVGRGRRRSAIRPRRSRAWTRGGSN